MGRIVTFLLFCLSSVVLATQHSERKLKLYVYNKYEKEATEMCYKSSSAAYKALTNITKENQEASTAVTLEVIQFEKELYEYWFKDVDVESIKDPTFKRMMKGFKLIGITALSDEDVKELEQVKSEMKGIYSTSKICPYTKQDCDLETEGLPLTPDAEGILKTSKDYDELAYVWTAWHDNTGVPVGKLYPKYVELNNKMAKLNGFKDYGEYWRAKFDTETFEEDLEEIWETLRPLYEQLHKFVSAKLRETYTNLNTSDGYLPAHIFGNMWAQEWGMLESVLRPFPEVSSPDITEALKKKGLKAFDIFEIADDFYTSLGLPSNAMSYGPGSVIERPDDREVLCHASAWDLCYKGEYYIKMCTEVDEKDFFVVHHEMGHIQYYQLYQNQSLAFRTGANPGFHEAIGDTISLSVGSIKHLKAIGMLDDDYKSSKEATINAMLVKGLSKIAALPWEYLIDKWRWDVLAGKVTQEEWNDRFWEYRKKYQMIKPPSERTSDKFDPGAKYHVPGDSQYISYFVSAILQFQFYRSMCVAAGEYDLETKTPPLHECDFYKSHEAGQIFKDGLSLGSSKPWTEVLEIMTGSTKLDASALVDYFAPLSEYLRELGY